MLRFEAEAGPMADHDAAFARHRAVEEVAGVELNAGLGRRDVQRASRCRLDDVRGEFQRLIASGLTEAIRGIPRWSLGLALGLTALNYAVLTGYDQLAFADLGRSIARWRISLASFIGYGPIPNPRFITLIRLFDPATSIHGANTAAPMFAELAPKILGYLHVPSNFDRKRKR